MPIGDLGHGRHDLAGTRSALVSWFAAIWYVVNHKQGVSALALQRVLGLGSHETAWTWQHKLRRAMVLPGRELLAGAVEIDETYEGARHTSVGGRKPWAQGDRRGRRRGRPGARAGADATDPQRSSATPN